MSYVPPDQLTEQMVEQGASKSSLSATQLMLRAGLSVFLLGGATSLAITTAEQTGLEVLGALVFPMGLAAVVLLGLELVTGNFALIPLALMERRTTLLLMLRNFGWVVLGHLIGGLLCALMFAALLSQFWTVEADPLIDGLIDSSVSQTLDYQQHGPLAGPSLAMLSGILCNWLVALGVVLGMTSNSTVGKMVALWPPIVAFYALDLEHSVVNFFLIPTGMMLGAPVDIGDWLLWNQIPVLLGNFVGGFLLTGLPLYLAYRSVRSREG